MIKQSVKEILAGSGVVPVVTIERAEDAAPLAKALAAAELPLVEVTFRTAAAEKAIGQIRDLEPGVCVGAGTVLTVEQARAAAAAGASFIVSPGFGAKVVSWCLENDMPVYPGCSTFTDVQTAIDAGLDTVKFFPAESSGGAKRLKLFGEIFSDIKFMPTGGVSNDNLFEYLSLPNVIACGGTWIAPKELISAGRFDEITSRGKAAVKTALGFSVAHVGINNGSAEEALSVAGELAGALGLPITELSGGYFAGTLLESLKHVYLGQKGHIGINTPSVERAMAYLLRRGVSFNQKSAVYDDSGKLICIYFDKEIGGFAVHLRKN